MTCSRAIPAEPIDQLTTFYNAEKLKEATTV